jgi:hypothetical protein
MCFKKGLDYTEFSPNLSMNRVNGDKNGSSTNERFMQYTRFCPKPSMNRVNGYNNGSSTERFIQNLVIPVEILVDGEELLLFVAEKLDQEYVRLGKPWTVGSRLAIINGLAGRRDVSSVARGDISMRLTFGA